MLTSLYFDCCEIRETGQWNSLRKKDGNVKERNREMSSSFDEGPKVRESKELGTYFPLSLKGKVGPDSDTSKELKLVSRASTKQKSHERLGRHTRGFRVFIHLCFLRLRGTCGWIESN